MPILYTECRHIACSLPGHELVPVPHHGNVAAEPLLGSQLSGDVRAVHADDLAARAEAQKDAAEDLETEWWERYLCVDTRADGVLGQRAVPTESIQYEPLPWFLIRRGVQLLNPKKDDDRSE